LIIRFLQNYVSILKQKKFVPVEKMSGNADKSAGARTRYVRAQTLATYHVANPNTREGGKTANVDSSVYTIRLSGGYPLTTTNVFNPPSVTNGPGCDPPCEPAPAPAPSCLSNSDIQNLGWTSFTPEEPYLAWSYGWHVSWDPIPSATSFELYQIGSSSVYNITGPNSADLYTNEYNDIVLVVHKTGCPDISGVTAPCFLAGSLVVMGDHVTRKKIEDVCVGDKVCGAFGEINTVTALHRPLLGKHTLTRINGEHTTTSHHPHVSADKKFYAVDISTVVEKTYGRLHNVIDGTGTIVARLLRGLRADRILPLKEGVVLKYKGGSRAVRTLETIVMPEDTQLYNLVVNGSHTYYVEEYAVTGWPREDDFDYDRWISKNVTPLERILPALKS